jgi:hypothetical protein
VALGKRRTRQEGLANLRFHQHDVTAWAGPDGTGRHRTAPMTWCSAPLGAFFFPDMDRDTAKLTTLLRPGGRLAVTIWEKGALGGWGQALKNAVETERAWPGSPQSDQLARIDTPTRSPPGWSGSD